MWYVSRLAETNRAPFDLTEGESELVSGYKVEYAGAPFALFFIGEYANIIIMNLVSVVLFFGRGSPFSFFPLALVSLIIKTVLLVFSFLWVRSSFPRVRYDQLMDIMWKNFLPLSIALLMLYCLLLYLFGGVGPRYLQL